jgi:hypothetical protein
MVKRPSYRLGQEAANNVVSWLSNINAEVHYQPCVKIRIGGWFLKPLGLGRTIDGQTTI